MRFGRGGGLISECMCGVWEWGGGVGLMSEWGLGGGGGRRTHVGVYVWGLEGGGGIGLMSDCMGEIWEGGGGVGSSLSVFGAGGGGHVSMGMQDLHLDNIKTVK